MFGEGLFDDGGAKLLSPGSGQDFLGEVKIRLGEVVGGFAQKALQLIG